MRLNEVVKEPREVAVIGKVPTIHHEDVSPFYVSEKAGDKGILDTLQKVLESCTTTTWQPTQEVAFLADVVKGSTAQSPLAAPGTSARVQQLQLTGTAQGSPTEAAVDQEQTGSKYSIYYLESQ